MHKRIPIALIHKYLYIDSTSPSGLRWSMKMATTVHKDSIAGTRNLRGYWQVSLKGVVYYAHRLIWVLFYNEDPYDKVINHIDCNTSNNAVSNLELCSIADNNRRTKSQVFKVPNISNTSGITGVREHKDARGNYHAHASWYDLSSGKQQNRYYSYAKYGIMEAWSYAVSLRIQMETH